MGMTMTKTETLHIEIKGPENSVESYVHELYKSADEGERFGVKIDIERINTEELQDNAFD